MEYKIPLMLDDLDALFSRPGIDVPLTAIRVHLALAERLEKLVEVLERAHPEPEVTFEESPTTSVYPG